MELVDRMKEILPKFVSNNSHFSVLDKPLEVARVEHEDFMG